MTDRELMSAADGNGTPLYVYDFEAMADRARAVKSALAGSAKLLFAVKANPNKVLLRHAIGWADGLDISSGGELALALAAGWDASKLSLAGPGKSPAELDAAVRAGCGSISAESPDDLENILAAGRRVGATPSVSLRVNPAELGGPFALKMGGRPTQFGFDEEAAAVGLSRLLRAEADGLARYAGLHVYAGTQCLEAAPIVANVANTLRIAAELAEALGRPFPHINLGGGFGVAYYEGQAELDLAEAGRGIAAAAAEFRTRHGPVELSVELGRYLTAHAGWYLTRVMAVKESRGKTYAVVDGGMHHNLSASGNLGQTIKRNYRMRNLSRPGAPCGPVELAGCLCTPIDLLGFGAPLAKPEPGDLICLENSGAYGFSSSPLLFLGHDAPAELAKLGGELRRVRKPVAVAFLGQED